MLETTLDRMVRKSVEETLNAMPDASGRRDHRHRQRRAQRGAEGVPGRPFMGGTWPSRPAGVRVLVHGSGESGVWHKTVICWFVLVAYLYIQCENYAFAALPLLVFAASKVRRER